MSKSRMYWLEDDAVPFATFLQIIQTYYHPEVRHDNFAELVQLARQDGGGDKMAAFKQELAQLVSGGREGLRPNAIGIASGYDDWATDEEFLAWLWNELYPSEPVPSSAADKSN
ncbi:hypothetical protein ACIA49_28210 [Kribbella sp. NPDC051587]|uniref:hypothetical protein n=1 Tax=Kribbella sp. NPDC051587 TaxID=3364119 RepID=UPI0037AD7176